LVLISPVGVVDSPSDEIRIQPADYPWRIRMISALWRNNFTPQVIVRMYGSGGENFVRRMITGRFGQGKFDDATLDVLTKYMYQVTAAPPCGEYALNSLLEPVLSRPVTEGAVAGGSATDVRSKIYTRMSQRPPPQQQQYQQQRAMGTSKNTTPAADNDINQELSPAAAPTAMVYAKESLNMVFSERFGRQNINNNQNSPLAPPTSSAKLPPTVIIYGDHDWLYSPAIHNTVNAWQQQGVAERVAVSIVSQAGHHLYLDNPPAFHEVLKRFESSI